LLGTSTIATGTTATVDFQSAQFGWYGDGNAVLTGPGTLATSGVVSVTDWSNNLQLTLAGGITWNSAGTVYDYGWTVLTGGATWNNTGTIYDRYQIQFGTGAGDSATIVNQAGALFDMNSGNSGLAVNGAGTYSFVNAGTLLQDQGGTDRVYVPVTNTGLVKTTNGLLEIYGANLGGTFQAAGGSLALLGTSTIATGTPRRSISNPRRSAGTAMATPSSTARVPWTPAVPPASTTGAVTFNSNWPAASPGTAPARCTTTA